MAQERYKITGKTGLFDNDFNLEKLISIGSPLDKLSKEIDFEMFRGELEENMLNHDKKSKAGANRLMLC
jgi:hypothetical protein